MTNSEPTRLLKLDPFKNIPVLTTGNIIINVEVARYRCWRCGYHTEDQHDLTFPNGIYDRGIVLNAVAFYTCGCSYELTRSLIFSQFHVAPIKSTILEWVQQIGKSPILLIRK